MKIGICDDEKEIRAMLRDKVQSLYPKADILLYSSGKEVLAGELPDILLLDIQMQGKSGIETAKELRRMGGQVIIIFVTAIEDYVFQAFDVDALHYLVKPFANDKFLRYYIKRSNSLRTDKSQKLQTAKKKSLPFSSLREESTLLSTLMILYMRKCLTEK